ncbi:MAG: M48 family metalloprotease [Deltaproteobacteria bacterium]|nr:M48 family metalloprotease [Deltaproteobacteria bacterium]
MRKKTFLSAKRSRGLALLACLAVLSMAGCANMDKVANLGAAVGVATGTIDKAQAKSLCRAGKAVAKTFQDITPSQEYYIGRAIAASILKRYPAWDNPAANAYVNLLGQSLALFSDRPETFGGYHFLILDSDEVNAFAAPGGLVFVTRGMLRCCRSESALAAVLAHEITHVQEKHGLRAIKKSRLTQALTIIGAESARNFGSEKLMKLTNALEGTLADITKTLIDSGYSRATEREADQGAVAILKRVGYDTRGMVDMLTVLEERTHGGKRGFAATHPPPKRRIRNLKNAVDSGPAPAVPPERRERFLALANAL